MKTLQELWDKVSMQQAALASLSRQNSLLLVAYGVPLPWNFRNAPSPSGPLDLAFDAEGRATVAYIDSLGAIRLARFDGAAWTGEEVAPDSTGLNGISLAFAPDGTPAMAFQANTLGGSEIGYAYYDGSTWQTETVDARNPAASICSLAFSPAGQPAIAHGILTTTNLIFKTQMIAVIPESSASRYQTHGLLKILPYTINHKLAAYGSIVRSDRPVGIATARFLELLHA